MNPIYTSAGGARFSLCGLYSSGLRLGVNASLVAWRLLLAALVWVCGASCVVCWTQLVGCSLVLLVFLLL